MIYDNFVKEDGRVLKELGLRANGHVPSWVRSPLLVIVEHVLKISKLPSHYAIFRLLGNCFILYINVLQTRMAEWLRCWT